MGEPEGLTRQRCLHHPAREAAARCPDCRSYVCRECVSEHGDQVLCASCLARVAAAHPRSVGRLAVVAGGARLLLGVVVAWLFFYLAGQVLMSIPDTFHATASSPAPPVAPATGPP